MALQAYFKINSVAIFIALAAVHPAAADDPLPVVPFVEIQRYLGTWHEIARIDHSFQKGCYNSSAEYALRDDGDIKVINRCSVAGKTEPKEAIGRAWILDKETNAKLRVQFVLTRFKLGFLSGNYWVLALDDDYHYVMIGEPTRDYLWILARDKMLSPDILKALVAKAGTLGYDTSRLLYNSELAK